MSRAGDRSRRRAFDLRVMIGGVFVVYGVALTVAGLLDTPADLAKADGLPINLWTGIGMLVLGGLFFAWARFGHTDTAGSDEDPTSGS